MRKGGTGVSHRKLAAQVVIVVAAAAARPVAAQITGAAAPRCRSSAPANASLQFSPVQLAELDLASLLDVPVVTGSAAESSLEESPSIVTVFLAEDIDRLGIRNLADLLHYVPGMFEVSAQLERNFAIRGIHAASAQHFVIMRDGLAMHDFLTSSASPDMFDLSTAARVEIVRGPGSALYGASALAGVINIITQEPETSCWRTSASLGVPLSAAGSMVLTERTGSEGELVASASFRGAQGTRWHVDGSEDVLIPTLGQNISDGIQSGENLTSPRPVTAVRTNRLGPSFDLFLKYRRDRDWVLRANLAQHELYLQRTHRQALVDARTELQPPVNLTRRLVVDLTRSFGSRTGQGELRLRPSLVYVDHDMRSQTVAADFFDRAAPQESEVIFGWGGDGSAGGYPARVPARPASAGSAQRGEPRRRRAARVRPGLQLHDDPLPTRRQQHAAAEHLQRQGRRRRLLPGAGDARRGGRGGCLRHGHGSG